MISSSLLLLLACSNGPEVNTETPLTPDEVYQQQTQAGGELFKLDIAKGERLLDITTSRLEENRSRSLYLIGSYKGMTFLHLNKSSEPFAKVLGTKIIEKSGMAPEYLAIVQNKDGMHQLIHVANGEYATSKAYNQVRFGAKYGDDGRSYAYVGTKINKDSKGRKSSKERVIFFDGDFDYGPIGSRVSGVSATPDEKTVEYRLGKGWAVGKEKYKTEPQWHNLSKFWMYTAKSGKGFEIVAEYKFKAAFDSLANQKMVSDKRLLMTAVKDKEHYVLVLSGEQSETMYAAQGPFSDILSNRRRPIYHQDTELPYFAVQNTSKEEVDGKERTKKVQKLLMMKKDYSWHLSSAYDRVALQREVYKKGPLAIANTTDGQVVLRGSAAGPEVRRVVSLQSAFDGDKVIYIGNGEESQAVHVNEEAGKSYKTVRNLSKTKGSDAPYYIGVNDNGEAGKTEEVILNKETSKPVAKVTTLRLRKSDHLVWLANQGEGQLVGIDTTLGEVFPKIMGINLTAKEALWYDAKNEDSLYRVLETTKSRAYARLSRPMFTSISSSLYYHGRVLDQSGEFASAKDYIVVGTKDIADFAHSASDSATDRKLVQGSGSPSLYTVRGSDSVYFTASSNDSFYAGLDTEKWGPFDAVTKPLVFPKETKLAYTAMKGETWAVQVNGDRHDDLTRINRLRFSLDGINVRYEAALEKQSLAYVGKERYLKVGNEKLNRNKDIFTYQGQREAGWKVYFNYEAGEAYDKLSSTTWTPDGYGIELVGTKGSSQHLIQRLHEKAHTKHKGYARASTAKRYTLPYTSKYGVPYLKLNKDGKTYSITDRPSRANDFDPTSWTDKEGNTLTLPSYDKREKVYLSIDSSFRGNRYAWIIEKIEDGKITLLNGPTEDFLAKAQRSSSLKVHVKPLFPPFTYAATKGKKGGTVHNTNFYTRFSGQEFTSNRRFRARGTDSEGDRIIVDEKRTAAFPKLQSYLIPKWDENADDTFAIKARDGLKSSAQAQWVISDYTCEVTELGYVDRLKSGEWTDWSSKGQHTVSWKGVINDTKFEAVAKEKYKYVRNLGVASNGALYYIGNKHSLESLFIDGSHPDTDKDGSSDWYLRIRDFTMLDGAVPSYIGRHKYSAKNNRINVHKTDYNLERLVIGDGVSPWVDEITARVPGTSIDSTVYVALQDNYWKVFRGAEALSDGYEAIGWFSGKTSDGSYHYLGLKSDGWHEVHNGSESRVVESILPLPEVSGASGWAPVDQDYWRVDGTLQAPSSFTQYCSANQRSIALMKNGHCPAGHARTNKNSCLPLAPCAGDKMPKVLVNSDGEFLYKAQQNDDEVVVYNTLVTEPAYRIDSAWLLDGGARFVHSSSLRPKSKVANPKNLFVDGKSVIAYTTLTRAPVFDGVNKKVYSIVSVSIPKLEDKIDWMKIVEHRVDVVDGIVARSGDPAALQSYLAANQLAYPYEIKLIEDATVVDQGSLIDAQGNTPRISVVTNQAGQHIYHSGNKSNDFEAYAGSAIWKDTLANSRYLYNHTVNGSTQSFVGSADKVLGPFEERLARQQEEVLDAGAEPAQEASRKGP